MNQNTNMSKILPFPLMMVPEMATPAHPETCHPGTPQRCSTGDLLIGSAGDPDEYWAREIRDLQDLLKTPEMWDETSLRFYRSLLGKALNAKRRSVFPRRMSWGGTSAFVS
jgi:hypothetical protein